MRSLQCRLPIPGLRCILNLYTHIYNPAAENRLQRDTLFLPCLCRRPKLSLAKLTSAGYSVSNGPNPAISSCAVPPVSGGGIAAQNALTPVEQTLASRLSRPSLGSRNLLRHLEKQNPVTSPGSQQVNSRSSKNRDPEPSPTPQLPAPAGTFANFFAGRSSARDDRRPSAKSPPVLGRGLQGVEAGSPNCLIDLGPVVSSSHTSTAPPARNAARMRAEAFVRARGGVARLEAEARKVAVGSRVSELVASSGSSQTTRPSPLSELLGNAPSNGGPTKSASRDSETSRSDADLQEGEKSRREAKRAELARLVSQGSQYTELVELEADLSDRSLLCRLEKRDEFEERLLSQHEQECQIVTCKTVRIVSCTRLLSVSADCPSSSSDRMWEQMAIDCC
ncbi:unnamed protein product [Schistocephalus solidus]|uniref:Mcm10 domain-containing protein n=1 Tax=Schistocephalus solidus TaxID=70667 RepID=A0A183SHF6_SCHSO|nr:unnamed protein product [Schistocephalus solidus]